MVSNTSLQHPPQAFSYSRFIFILRLLYASIFICNVSTLIEYFLYLSQLLHSCLLSQQQAAASEVEDTKRRSHKVLTVVCCTVKNSEFISVLQSFLFSNDINICSSDLLLEIK